MWGSKPPEIEPPPQGLARIFTEAEQKQILVIVTGCLLAAIALLALWQLFVFARWLGAKLHTLLGCILSWSWWGIRELLEFAVKIGQLGTGFLILGIATLGFLAYNSSPPFIKLLLSQWEQLVLPLLLRVNN
jgi:hypothetical protein